MISRRRILYGGLGLFLGGALPGLGRSASAGGRVRDEETKTTLGFGPGAPILALPLSEALVDIGGFPFVPRFTGDPFPFPHLRYPQGTHWFQGDPPPPEESADIVIVGGGISGLSAAHLLREYDPIVLDLNERFGGSARGEWWNGVTYSIGGAYFITPDAGSVLDSFYRDLGLDTAHRLDSGQSEVELAGQILRDEFWSGAGRPPEEVMAFERYAEVVTEMAHNYPEIPLVRGQEEYVLELDGRDFEADIRARMGMAMPADLEAAIQAYCYSSFAAGWQEISAASGWNFLAAEEYGRWVCEGGNAQMAQRLWESLAARPAGHSRLRPNALVVDVRLVTGGVQVTWADREDQLHSILAQRAVMSCPKNVARNILFDVAHLDPEKNEAMHSTNSRGYIVANVLLEAPIDRDFYDIFLLGDGSFPMDEGEAQRQAKVIDVLNGRFFRGPQPGPRSVLTLYWPLPWSFGQHELLNGLESWRRFATRLVPQLDEILALFDVDRAAVRGVRLSAFGHSMPLAYPGFIASGQAEAVRRPIEDRIFFVEQDNWALPAVENCILDAAHYAPQIARGL